MKTASACAVFQWAARLRGTSPRITQGCGLRLRRALSLAIDREFIAERVWAGTMLPAYGVIPPHIGNYGEVFDRNLAPIGLQRGPNALWINGGLQYSPPFR